MAIASQPPASVARLARRYVWWMSSDEALRERQSLLCQLLKLGTAEDYVLACNWFGEEAVKEALARARPGALDERSWEFWHRHYRLPLRPFPRRHFR